MKLIFNELNAAYAIILNCIAINVHASVLYFNWIFESSNVCAFTLEFVMIMTTKKVVKLIRKCHIVVNSYNDKDTCGINILILNFIKIISGICHKIV